ncbi:hypothetical protein BGZ76_003319 [Entomortierella beljakovae]|nr:hypothetical protein BGZ76_003319 [Entomortierella beljakovae]
MSQEKQKKISASASVADKDQGCDNGTGASSSQSEALVDDHTSSFDPPLPHNVSQQPSTSLEPYIGSTGIRRVEMPDFSHISFSRSEAERRVRKQGRDSWKLLERQFTYSHDSFLAQRNALLCLDDGTDMMTPDTSRVFPVDENFEWKTVDELEKSIKLCQEAVNRAKRSIAILEDDDSEEDVPTDRREKKVRFNDSSPGSSGSL